MDYKYKKIIDKTKVAATTQTYQQFLTHSPLKKSEMQVHPDFII